MKAFSQCVVGAAAMLSVGVLQAAPQQIQVWHALDAVHKQSFENLVKEFNKSQNEVAVELSSAPTLQAMQAGVLQAIKEKKTPHLVQLSDNYDPEAVAKDYRVQPLYEILNKYPVKDLKWFLPQTTSFVRDSKNRLLALPLMAEVPVLFYNRDLLKKAGLEDRAPATWQEMQGYLVKLQGAGQRCPYASSQTVWVHQENLASSNSQPFASRNNGLDGGRTDLLVNDLLHIRHLSMMATWVRSGLMPQVSMDSAPDAMFARGECAMLTSGSGAWASLKKAGFSPAVAPVPSHEEGVRKPGNPLVGGSSLWALSGHPAAEQKAVAQFIAWLASPNVAARWHQETGYLPMTEAAARAADVSFYQSIPGAQKIVQSMQAAPGPNSRGMRLTRYPEINAILAEETMAALSGQKPPMKAQLDAVARASAAMGPAPAPAKTAAKK